MAAATDYRAMAADCRSQARAAGASRARQLRECARTFMQLALRQQLFEYGKQVGRSQVTLASFREHLRAERA